MSGRFLRMRLATWWVKSGLSMMTTTSGSAAIAASTVSWTRRMIVGRRPMTADMPMTAMSCSGKMLERP